VTSLRSRIGRYGVVSWFFLLEKISPGIHLPGFFFWYLGFSFGIFVTRALSVFRQKIRDAIYLRFGFYRV
ncbi:MAG: hypothetical protein WCF34_03495, partial [Pseudolabrys sp.]